uniref:Uncharacterized protein n=1 Tax=Cannabis sativa TaxID=3483 RepID=A0A803PKK0_CANSA
MAATRGGGQWRHLVSQLAVVLLSSASISSTSPRSRDLTFTLGNLAPRPTSRKGKLPVSFPMLEECPFDRSFIVLLVLNVGGQGDIGPVLNTSGPSGLMAAYVDLNGIGIVPHVDNSVLKGGLTLNGIGSGPISCGPLVINDMEIGGPSSPLNELGQYDFLSVGQKALCSTNDNKALCNFFQAQESLIQELKHFGKLDLYEIRTLGGDIGVKSTSEINIRTTPFKKRKLFEVSASLCSRSHKMIRSHSGVIRDFPWDTKDQEQDKTFKIDFEDPSEVCSDSLSRSDDILKNPLIGSLVFEEFGSSSYVHSQTPVEENVLSPPQEP